MSWKIEVKPTAAKQYLKLDKKTRVKIKTALKELEQADNPWQQNDVKPFTGKLAGDYRLRVGKWRLLFTPDKDDKILYVYAILPRGDAY